MNLEKESAILGFLLLYVYESCLITQPLRSLDETRLLDVQMTQLQTLIHSYYFTGFHLNTTKPMIQTIYLMVTKYDHLIGISGNTDHTLMYKVLTEDTCKVIYFSRVQVADNLDNQSIKLNLPDWDRAREEKDYHRKW